MKNKKRLTIGFLVAFIALVAGVSYAYFTATFQNLGERETSITLAEMGSLKLTATQATYTSGNQYPGDMAIQKFTVEPVSKGSGIYELDLTGVIDESIFGSDVEIQLYKSIDNTEVTVTEGDLTQEGDNFSRVDTLVTNGLVPVYNKGLKNGLNILFQEEFEVIEESGVLKVRENSTSTSYPKYTFYLVYNYKNNGNQNNQMGQTFNGTISGRLVKELSGAGVIAKLAGNAPRNSTALIDNGEVLDGEEVVCTNTLAYDDFGNLRYVGANPCNYVTFNGETAGWRIIGVFDNQIKLIRNESIGDYSWDSSASSVNSGYGINQWGESGTYTGADLMKLLNPGFEENLAEDASGNEITGTYANNSLYWNKQSGNCYNNLENAYTTCDFSATGLTESAKTMIDKHTWNLGSQGENDVLTSGNGLGLASKFYEYERSNNNGKICTSGKYCNDTVNRTTSWEGYVGLMSPSDYGYAVGGEVRDTCLNLNLTYGGYNTNNCYSNDWLFNSNGQWTMSPYADSSPANCVFRVYSDGYLNFAGAGFRNSVRPDLFLIPSIEISGEGTPSSPFTLSVG
ncbi:MAG: hypothetical protein IJ704_02695 [Bacilli bacterium]|nr:hypothetical protein [Bacilli bacterium]